MGSCLGIYTGDKIIKYAKLTTDKENLISIDSYGTKSISVDKNQTIQNIIKETSSAGTPIAINLTGEIYSKIEIFKHLSKKDVESIIELEFEDVTNGDGQKQKEMTYKYVLAESTKSKDNYSATLITAERNVIEEIIKTEGQKVKGLYPYPYIMNNIIPKGETNYAFISMEEETNITMVLDGITSEIKKIGIGMREVIEKLAVELGSYDKAYETCKALNVYTEDENPNNPEIESIIEPILQEILHKIEAEILPIKKSIKRIYITGMGTLFTNIDMLFEQYFGITSEIVKPYFIKNMGTVKSITELVEANAAISLAYESIFNENSDINFMAENSKKTLFNLDATAQKIDKLKQNAFDGDSKSIAQGLTLANIIAATILFIYIMFVGVYNMQIKKIEKNITSKNNELTVQTKTIDEDINYINEQKEKYADINSLIKNNTDKIEGNSIGKYSTYNVANFMQKIMKYIPKDIELVSIASNDNKKVTIIAKSDSYSGLGYFVSQLKLEGILTNILVKNVEHGSNVTVTIEGVLP